MAKYYDSKPKTKKSRILKGKRWLADDPIVIEESIREASETDFEFRTKEQEPWDGHPWDGDDDM